MSISVESVEMASASVECFLFLFVLGVIDALLKLHIVLFFELLCFVTH